MTDRRQLDLFPAKRKPPRASAVSPINPRTKDERTLVAVLESAAKPRQPRYSSAAIRRLMTPLPRITVFDPPCRRSRLPK